MKFIMKLLATGLGSGYVPRAPGTAGTIIGTGLYLLLKDLSLLNYSVFVIVFFFLASWVSSWGMYHFGELDPKRVVIDEIAGFLVTMLAFPFHWSLVVAGFLLFRFYDVLKPFPIRWIDEKVKGGFGIVLDDILAGIYANMSMWILIWIALKAGVKA